MSTTSRTAQNLCRSTFHAWQRVWGAERSRPKMEAKTHFTSKRELTFIF